MNNTFEFTEEYIKDRIVRIRIRLARCVAKIPDLNVTDRRAKEKENRRERNSTFCSNRSAIYRGLYADYLHPGTAGLF